MEEIRIESGDILKPNPFVGACHIPDPINRDLCMLCGKRITIDSMKKEEE